MSYLVIGSSGLVGKAFCNYLRSKNKSVLEWDIKISPDFDLRNPNNLNRFQQYIKKSDYILFAAYDIGGSKFIESVDINIFTNNLQIMMNVFPFMTDKSFIFLSSQMSNLIDNKYGISKKVGEIYTQMYKGINVRLWNVYGYESEINIRSHAITDFIDMGMRTGSINMLSDGQEQRQFVYDSDCAEALFIVFENYESFRGETIDLSSGEWIRIKDIAQKIADIMNNVCVVPGKVKTIEKLREPNNFLNNYWKPKITIDEGLKIIVDKFKDKIITKIDLSSPLLTDVIQTTLSGTGDSDQHLATMFSIVLQLKAKRILELGVRGGSTTLPLLLGAEKTGGTVISVDINNTEFICPEHLQNIWTFKKQDALSFLKDCSNIEKPWDLIFIDDWHSYDHVKAELELLDFQVGSSTIILLHDLMYANFEPHYHSDMDVREGQWANGGPYRAVAEMNKNFWEFATIPVCNGLTVLRKKYSKLKFP
jgi:nucleoside-diphosphate-sugar epimerase/predicted O-methyltransferase YrrM